MLSMTHGTRRSIALCLAAGMLLPAHEFAAAQGVPRSDSTAGWSPRRELAAPNPWVLAGLGAATAALIPLDRQLRSAVRDDELVANRSLARMSSAVRFFGSPGPLLIGGALYLGGRAAHQPRVTELALHGTEAVVAGAAAATVVKIAAGRARPYVSGDAGATHFEIGRGLHHEEFRSFPSGHTTIAFAAAAATTEELGQWWPERKPLIATVMYGGATLVGVSRMYDDKHWASDVAMGAAIGTFVGLATVRFNHAHPDNRLDRLLLGRNHGHLGVVPGIGGVTITWTNARPR